MVDQEIVDEITANWTKLNLGSRNREYNKIHLANQKLELFKKYYQYKEEWEEVFRANLYGDNGCYQQYMSFPCQPGPCENCVEKKMYSLLLYNSNHIRER